MSQCTFNPEPPENTLTHHVLVCTLCNSTIGPTGDCSYGCENDMMYAKKRPRGTVLVRTYQMTLVSEKPYDF